MPESLAPGSVQFADSQRLRGIKEHFARVELFFSLSSHIADTQAKYRLLMAAIYSCRAIPELLLTAAWNGDVESLKHLASDERRTACESAIRPLLPFYDLVERIRIHDFHRLGVVAPHPDYKTHVISGPLKVGGTSVVLTDAGLQAADPTRVKFQRPLLIDDGLFFDDESRRYVTLEEVLAAFIGSGSTFLDAFDRLLVSPPSQPKA